MTIKIAFDQRGTGTPLILVVGAFNTRTTGAELAAALAADHTVITYDRRGRGDSEDSAPYAIEREIEDLAGLMERVGGSAAVLGFSSGAALALAAAAAGLPITQLVLFDLPLTLAPPAVAVDHAAALDALVTAGRRGDAVEYFQRHLVGLPAPVIGRLRSAPFRPALEALAHTLVYDATIVGTGQLDLAQVRAVRVPILALAAGQAPAFMHETAHAIAAASEHARALVLEGAAHDLDPAVLVPPLRTFLT